MRRIAARLRGALPLLAALSLLPPVRALAQQPGVVAGRVLDAATLQPISGAQVVVEGTSTGGLSDPQGRFRIGGLSGTSVTLRVVMIGYRDATQPARIGDLDVRIALTQAAVSLDQVVVTGTAGGTQKRALGNTVARVDIAQAQQSMPATQVTDLLNGRAAGVVVTPGTGMVGAGPRIRIRGAKSLSLSDQPLVYVDGVRVDNDVAAGPLNQGYGSGSINRLGDFNPDDIESMEIIKGPAAATLYGTEATNGVIQIITKKGKGDMPAQWDVAIRQGANWISNPAGRIPANWGIDKNTGQLVSVNLVEHEAARGTPLFRTGRLQDYNLSVRGGGSTTRYFVSGQYERDQGTDVNNDVWRYSARSNLGFAPNPKWDISANLSYVKASIGLASDISDGVLFNSMFSTNVDTAGPRRGFRSSPPEVFHQRARANQGLDRFTGSLVIQHKPAAWLTQRVALGLDQTQEVNTTVYGFLSPADAVFYSPTSAQGSKRRTDVGTAVNTVDYGATAKADLSPTLTSSTSIGLQYFRRLTSTLDATGTQFTGPGLSTLTGTARTSALEDLIENTTVGSFVQEEVGWQDRVFLTGAVRVDNNSAFGSDFKWVTYPKVSASWVVNEEPFWHVPWVNTLRLRAAYGASGHQPDAFAALRTFKPVTVSGGEGGVTPQFVGNPDLKPERGKELETGFEAGLFQDRLGIDVSFYSERTDDAILLKPLAPSGGFPGSQFVNIGSLKNTGAELQLKATVIRADAAAWDLGFNVSRNRSVVLDVGGAASGVTADGRAYIKIPSNLDTPGIHIRHEEGYPAGSYFGHRVVSAKLDPNGTAYDVMCDGGELSDAPLPCADAPDVFLGQTDPKVEGSITSSLTLKHRLTLSGLLDFKRGVVHGDNDTLVRCALFHNCEAWYKPLDYDPVFIAQIQSSSWHDFAAADASFFKLRQVSASYLVPERLAQRVGAGMLRVTVAMENLKTWTKWPSLDPETYFLTNPFDKWSQTFTPHPMSLTFAINATY
ncbi:MAG TPA: TonB-dependent receptor [Longimicrobiales bacterium]|nr:TonB-dependent receptor [Longimicrobiales bacterium]